MRTYGPLFLCLCLLAGSGAAIGQAKNNVPDVIAGAPKVTALHIKVHGASLEGSLEGDSADRDVLVFLPPSYAKEPNRRYPVVYALHGYSIGAEQWSQEIHVPQTIEGAFAKGARDMIVVLPDSKTVHNGSMYSSSVTTGDFENFIAHDLVAYIDGHYRTIPARESRGLAGHSMGGYGTTRIGMKHADVFGSLYIMSPCCLAPRTPLKPGDKQEQVLSEWAANAPLAFIPQYVFGLKRYNAIALDVGDQDTLRFDTAKLHETMDSFGIANSFEIYPGTHVSNVAFRFQDFVMPFFSKNLSFQGAR